MNDTNLKPTVYSENDFDRMIWHDCNTRAIAFFEDTYELAFDIDYIIEWIQPVSAGGSYTFLISPATLIFQNVYDVDFDLSAYNTALQMDNVTRADEQKPKNADFINRNKEWLWVISCQQDEIKFRSIGFRMQLMAESKLQESQMLDLSTRGGISFAGVPDA